MKTEHKIFSLFLLIIVLYMTLTSFKYSTGANTLPFFSGLFALAMLAMVVGMDFSPKVEAWHRKFEREPLIPEEDLTREEKRSEITVAVYFLGCTLCVLFLGFQVAIPLFLFVYLKIREKEGWLVSLILPAVVTGVIYFVFYYLLYVPLYEGMVFEY